MPRGALLLLFIFKATRPTAENSKFGDRKTKKKFRGGAKGLIPTAVQATAAISTPIPHRLSCHSFILVLLTTRRDASEGGGEDAQVEERVACTSSPSLATHSTVHLSVCDAHTRSARCYPLSATFSSSSASPRLTTFSWQLPPYPSTFSLSFPTPAAAATAALATVATRTFPCMCRHPFRCVAFQVLLPHTRFRSATASAKRDQNDNESD